MFQLKLKAAARSVRYIARLETGLKKLGEKKRKSPFIRFHVTLAQDASIVALFFFCIRSFFLGLKLRQKPEALEAASSKFSASGKQPSDLARERTSRHLLQKQQKKKKH